jgi:hypothetical protein
MAVWEILVEVSCNDGYSWGYTFKDFNGKFSLFSLNVWFLIASWEATSEDVVFRRHCTTLAQLVWRYVVK